jgi:hypothetical protein
MSDDLRAGGADDGKTSDNHETDLARQLERRAAMLTRHRLPRYYGPWHPC